MPIPVYNIDDQCDSKMVGHFKIASFNEESCTASEFEENHRHKYYEIVWLRKGSGIHIIDMVDYPYSGSVLFLLSPGQVHKIQADERAEGFIIKFLPELFSDEKDFDEYVFKSGLFDTIEASPLIRSTATSHSFFEDLYAKMNSEFNTNELDMGKMVLAYLKVLILHISRLKRQQHSLELLQTDHRYKLFQNFKQLVEKYYIEQHMIAFYSDNLGIQSRLLNDLTKKFAGKKASDILSERLILQAKRELYHNTMTVKEIAYYLGFEDPAYFTRFFKKNAGVSPLEYKRSLRYSI